MPDLDELTDEEEVRLTRFADRTGRSKRFHLKAALREYLTNLEDALAADPAIDAFVAGVSGL